MITQDYIDKLNTRFKAGISREHSYRGDLQNLLESIATDVLVTNEPVRVACGAPDYIITKRNIPVGYIEAKDIGADLNNKAYKEQFDRYRKSLNNLIITDYLTFQLFRDDVYVTSISIGQIQGNKIIGIPENYSGFTSLIKDFCIHEGQTIKSSKKLAEMMAGKARLLANVIEKALLPGDTVDLVNEPNNNTLHEQYESFQKILIHDITEKGFSDIYAQTIAYGMFAARLHDPCLESFSRQEAAELIPKSNPFLRKLFQYVAGYDLDDRIKWIVDALADIFRATNVAELLKDFGKATQQHDPIIHFYETFLSEYDPALRKSRGVWYTPEPVVKFIVRTVDDILKTEFGLSQGLADTSKTKIKVNVQGKKIEQEVHKVQILDPAAGTGTFLAEVVKHIYKLFEGQQGIWNNYVEEHLIPRLNGFEILMASYAMAHLKLDLLLTETGYKSTKDQRFRVYLTNSLEEHHPDTGTLFANWLSIEANEANYIKRDTPVMVVIGNPPYSGISSNNGEWISSLIDDYKYIDGEYFNERKHWLNDDYVKFIRYGQHFIEKNGSGVLAFINPHGFLDNPTFRGMRWHLLTTFDKIYTIDLHGNAKKKETAPDGSVDQNVFDIMQGVSINLFIKTGKKKANELGKVSHFDLYGEREYKYNFLTDNTLKNVAFLELKPEKPFLFFVPKNDDALKDYRSGFQVNEILNVNTVGFVSANDGLNISFSKKEQISKIKDLLDMEQINWRLKYNRQKDARDWTYITAKQDAQRNNNDNKLIEISYRPFDSRYTLYTGNSRGLYSSPQRNVMQHFLKGENVGLVIPKINKEDNCFFISNKIIAHKLCSAYDSNSVFPLYLYPETYGQQTNGQTTERTPNLNPAIVNQIAEKLGLTFTSEKTSPTGGATSPTPPKEGLAPASLTDQTLPNLPKGEAFGSPGTLGSPSFGGVGEVAREVAGEFAPIDILDYIYAVLHSPTYREKYKEFLKIDFPRVPYPKDVDTFWRLVKLGGELRQLHLLESPVVEKRITTYPQAGSNLVDKLRFENGKVWINAVQYFDNVPQVAWDFYIGGYQPAQKWLKDRKGRELSFEDILHYQKIIVALAETDRLMKEVDKIDSPLFSDGITHPYVII
ncbi:MAG: type ISP restriction/modification enzyme [Bacteroidales bacterium]